MITRREALKWSAVASAIATGTQAAFAMAPRGLDAVLIDRRFAAQAPQAFSGVPALHFQGDVTQVWLETIDPAWRRRGYVLGGITGSDALFVLETLAQQYGRRVTSRMVLGERDDRGVAPVGWVIAPVHPSVIA